MEVLIKLIAKISMKMTRRSIVPDLEKLKTTWKEKTKGFHDGRKVIL
jgi:hypothetical protein